MMLPRRILGFLIAFVLVNPAFSQDSLPKFAPPLDIPLILSGNFAELRSNHFHTGIDIKTSGVEGLKVRSAEKGYVSRIKVSPYGYGNAVYIEHPNGYTTVYGHLQSFSSKIQEAAKLEQLANQNFSVDFSPSPKIEIDRSEVIGLSGNSGGSGGPHLHFEIRETKSEKPQNPLLFGFNIEDNIPPRIRGVRFHPLSDSSLINGSNSARSFIVKGGSGDYYLKEGQVIEVSGPFGISVHGLDFLNGAPNKCGLYSVELVVDGKKVCEQEFSELDFATTRHINCYKDYEAFKTRRWHYHKSFVEPGNKLEIYKYVNDANGTLNLADSVHNALYTLKDAYGNTSTLTFQFTVKPFTSEATQANRDYDALFNYDSDNHFEYNQEISIDIPKGALYKDLKFEFGRELPSNQTVSPRYNVHNKYVPLQSAMRVGIKAGDISAGLRQKLVARRENPAGNYTYLAGEMDGENFSFESKELGIFALVLDTIKPELSLSKWSSSGVLDEKSILNFIGKDDMSGIKDFNATVNGEWVVLNYDPKNNRFWLRPGESAFKPGTNTLEITLEDYCENSTVLSLSYEYR
jgi:hypothetical protein